MGKHVQQVFIGEERLQRDEAGIPAYLHELREAVGELFPAEQGFQYGLSTDDGEAKLAGLLKCYSGWTTGFKVEVMAKPGEPSENWIEIDTISKAYRFGLICFIVVLLGFIGLVMFLHEGTITLGGMMFGGMIVGLPFLLIGTLSAHLLALPLGKQGHRFTGEELARLLAVSVEIVGDPRPEAEDESEAEEEDEDDAEDEDGSEEG